MHSAPKYSPQAGTARRHAGLHLSHLYPHEETLKPHGTCPEEMLKTSGHISSHQDASSVVLHPAHLPEELPKTSVINKTKIGVLPSIGTAPQHKSPPPFFLLAPLEPPQHGADEGTLLLP